MNSLIRIEVEPEDAETFGVGDELFAHVIVRVDRARRVVWTRPPSRWYRLRGCFWQRVSLGRWLRLYSTTF